MSSTNQSLITIREAATILNVSIPTMYNLANSKNFPVVIIGETNGRKLYRINKNKLEKWVENGGQAV